MAEFVLNNNHSLTHLLNQVMLVKTNCVVMLVYRLLVYVSTFLGPCCDVRNELR